MPSFSKTHVPNCDSNVPVHSRDTGTMNNITALHVTSLSFGIFSSFIKTFLLLFLGGLEYGLQYAAFLLGRLKCYGKIEQEENIFLQ